MQKIVSIIQMEGKEQTSGQQFALLWCTQFKCSEAAKTIKTIILIDTHSEETNIIYIKSWLKK